MFYFSFEKGSEKRDVFSDIKDGSVKSKLFINSIVPCVYKLITVQKASESPISTTKID